LTPVWIGIQIQIRSVFRKACIQIHFRTQINVWDPEDPKLWTNHEINYADGPEEGFHWHRPQELVGRCRLGTTVTKTVLLVWLNKKNFL
jgi:hypothetical protein